MFLYSNKDFYLKADYMEKNVLSLREIEGSQYKAFKFTGSKHVAHLRMHKKEYTNQVQNFIQMGPQEQDQKTIRFDKKQKGIQGFFHSFYSKFSTKSVYRWFLCDWDFLFVFFQ